MGDVTREFRVVDADGEVWPINLSGCDRTDAECHRIALDRAEPTWAPFRVESRTVTDWLETEQPADSATGCATTEASAP